MNPNFPTRCANISVSWDNPSRLKPRRAIYIHLPPRSSRARAFSRRVFALIVFALSLPERYHRRLRYLPMVFFSFIFLTPSPYFRGREVSHGEKK